MFSFWNIDNRGSEQPSSIEAHVSPLKKDYQSQESGDIATIESSTYQPLKKRRPSFDDLDELSEEEPVKRARTEDSACEVTTPKGPAGASNEAEMGDRVRDVIEHQLGLEILHKHNELRLIDQELAKCQVALEQLRRCHLIPYPTSAPTPAEMLNIAAGKGPAAQPESGDVPRWAPPFGVVEGPYARHYAKWLIPDPVFDGVEPEWQFTTEAAKARASFSQGRSSRNSFTENSLSDKRRPSRANAGAKLQALSSGYPQPKDKSGPCVLKRSDGKTVKLVCLDCHRENFSSTQGFINHCRIAHKRLFESHDHAAMQSGQPLEAQEAEAAMSKLAAPAPSKAPEKVAIPPSAAPSTAVSFVHPFARSDMTDQQACAALKSRLAESMALFKKGQLHGVTSVPTSQTARTAAKDTAPTFTGSSETPHLSKLLKHRKFNGSLGELVRDAKTRIAFEDITPDEESDDPDTDEPSRTLGAMRMPARAPVAPAPSRPPMRPRNGLSLDLGHSGTSSSASPSHDDDDLDLNSVHLSPTTLISNNAPSLVSDDGEYEDSDDAMSVSGSEAIVEDSETDVADITMVDDHEPPAITRRSSTVPCRQDEKHVTFMAPVEHNIQRHKRRKI